jgi:uncharacterized protein
MSEKFDDIPFESEMVPEMLDLGTKLKFRCHQGISCFNACCKQADITLTPYDIIRLKENLGKSSTDFLKEHTVPFQMEQDGLPGVKLRTTDDGVCLFMTEEGCSVYNDRPTSCRYYPLGHMSMRKSGAVHEETHYFLVQEEHCKGHEEERELSIQEYLQEQDTAYHDEMNKEWLQIMLKKRSAGPTVGALPESTLQMFFMCSYDMDRLRRFVLSDAFRATYKLEDTVYAALEKDDIPLMQFGVKFMKQAFFAERTIPESKDAWDKRVEQRQDVWDARREAELSRQQQMEDEKYKG